MYDNFSKALEHFITKQIVADHDQVASFEQIRIKLESERVDLPEVCCDLIRWVEEFTNDYHAHELQFDFEGNSDAEETLRNLLIQFIPGAYYSIYAYIELEEYKKLAQKKLHNNVVNEIQHELLHKELADFFRYVIAVVGHTGQRDRFGRVRLAPEESDLLENLSSLARQYNKAICASTPVASFLAKKDPVEEARPASDQLQTVKLFA
ncbi:MAG: hypothetical protein SFW07_03230 [Gammaproteobacteria bacterium]|nr:hypothetical protein [Gammaproteobacteria bacterium]